MSIRSRIYCCCHGAKRGKLQVVDITEHLTITYTQQLYSHNNYNVMTITKHKHIDACYVLTIIRSYLHLERVIRRSFTARVHADNRGDRD